SPSKLTKRNSGSPRLTTVYLVTVQTRELRCQCVKVFSHGISTGSIASVDFIPEGPHCIRPEVILTRKDGKQFCLNTTMPWVQKLVRFLSNLNKGLLFFC
uniref:Chemokine interleukin-8-like domain-containing protein n=1 Tax=Naja naja TaxID=35670 RepID=A0A8C6VKY0_NAJNA